MREWAGSVAGRGSPASRSRPSSPRPATERAAPASTLDRFLDWLTALPPAALYLVLAATAAVENVFPPFPSDTVVAFGSFIAARGHGSAVGSFLATWAGNIAGAMLMYALGRRYGASRLIARLSKGEGSDAEARIRVWYGRRG